MPIHEGTEVTVSVELMASGGKFSPRDVGVSHFFFGGLEYLTGLSPNGMTCDQYEKETYVRSDWANDGYLCNHPDDTLPEALRPVQSAES